MALEKSGSFRKTTENPYPADQLQWESWGRLMVRVQEGDADAYRLLLTELGPILFHFVQRRVYRSEWVQDIYQEVLLTFHKARHTYDPKRPLGPWLFTVARNALWLALKRQLRVAGREVAVEILPETPAVEKEEGLEDELHQALQTLPEDHRKAVELLKIKGLSLQEASAQLGISIAALKVRAHRGYVHLREKLIKEKGKKK